MYLLNFFSKIINFIIFSFVAEIRGSLQKKLFIRTEDSESHLTKQLPRSETFTQSYFLNSPVLLGIGVEPLRDHTVLFKNMFIQINTFNEKLCQNNIYLYSNSNNIDIYTY